MRWDGEYPLHTPVYYNTTLFLKRMCFPDVNSLKDVGADLLNIFNTKAAASNTFFLFVGFILFGLSIFRGIY